MLAALLLPLTLVFGATSTRADEAAVASPAPQSRFDVFELRVLGNTTLDARTIEAAVYPFTGPGKAMADIEAARVALERAYHDRGFGTVFVDIPEQSVDQNIVRLRVTEGRLRQVRVVGEKYFSGRQILSAVPAARENMVPNLPQVQAQLNALNAQTADRVVVPVLKAGPAPGTVDLALRVQDHLPFHGSVELNNQYTADTTHLRAQIAMNYDNMFGRLDSLSLQFQDSPEAPSESHVIAGSYALRLADSILSFQYINSKSDVATIGTLGVLGTGSIYGMRWMQPLSASGSSQNLSFEVDYKDFTQNIAVNATTGLATPVQYINLSAAYAGFRASELAQSDWNTTLNFGFRGTPNNTTQFADKRFDAQPNYFYIRSDGGMTVQLPAKFSATWRLTGQYAVDPLISNEQLPIGGALSVRGYLEAEELGDSAMRGSLQFGVPPLSLIDGRLRFDEFLFFDIARAFTVEPLAGQPHHTDLRSWGVGLKFQAFSHLYGNFTWAYPLTDAGHISRGDSMLLFLLHGYW